MEKILVVRELGSGDASTEAYETAAQMNSLTDARGLVSYPMDKSGAKSATFYTREGVWYSGVRRPDVGDWFDRTQEWCNNVWGSKSAWTL